MLRARYTTIVVAALALGTISCRGEKVFRLAGTIERTTLEVAAPISEVIVAIPVSPGQHVEAGEVLVQLDAEVAEAEARAQEAALAAASAGLAEAEGEFGRVEKLHERRVASVKELDRARRARDEALAVAAEREARWTQAKKRLADLTIRSHAAGIIDQLPFEEGERVPAGGVAAVLQTEREPWVRIWVPARAVALITSEARAEVEIEGFDQRLSGRLEDVSREPEFTPHFALTERESAHLVYRARVVLTDAPADLRPGLPAQVKLILPQEAEEAGMTDDRVIEARGLTRNFGSLVAVDGVDLDVPRGEVLGFLGPNGAGKSTLIRMLVGLLAPSSGTARVLGRELPRDAELLRPQIGYMTQRFSLYEDLTIEENLQFAAEIFGLEGSEGRARIAETLAEYDLLARKDARPATLSGGWKQRLALAVATVHKPDLLVLDEPTAGVDPERRRDFWAKLFELTARGATILVSTHYMDEAVRCHRVCMMIRGRSVAIDSPARLTQALEGRVVEVAAEPIEQAIAVLRSMPFTASVTQLGTRVHVLLAPGSPGAAEATPEILRRLEESGVDRPTAREAEPNLEDVFVACGLGESLTEARA